MLNPLVLIEGMCVDAYDHLIFSIYVDLRDPANQLPITTLIKGCRKQYAIELCKKIRISKPALFRKYGEGLILDPAEAYASHTEVDTEIIDDPHELASEQLLNEEFAEASELLQSNFKHTRRSKKTSHKTTYSLSFGKNGWIFSTSIEPESQEEKEKWRESMPDEYDHVSYIHRPREFARALGSMVAEQLGPQGQVENLNHSFDEIVKTRTSHRSQVIYHGPVIYVDDPYVMISNASSKAEFILRSNFVKGVEFQDQREYRFVILTEDEPSAETVDLDVSFAMLGAMQERLEGPTQLAPPALTLSDQPSDSRSTQIEDNEERVIEDGGVVSSLFPGMQSGPSPLDFIESDFFASVAPFSFNTQNLPHDLYEMTTTYSALASLQILIRNLKGERKIKAAASAWHAEPCIRRLCSIFEEPIENISISDSNFIVVTIKFPDESQSEAKIAIGPLGSCTFDIKSKGKRKTSFNGTVWSLRRGVGKELEEAGLRIRPNPSATASESLIEGS